MMRLIDADALIANEDLHINIGAGDNICIDIADIAKAPTIDPESLRQKGRWVHDDHFPSQCSECGMISPGDCELSGFYDSNFCPNCGDDMMEGGE